MTLGALGLLGTVLGVALASRSKRRTGTLDFLGGPVGFLGASSLVGAAVAAMDLFGNSRREGAGAPPKVVPGVKNDPLAATSARTSGHSPAAYAPPSQDERTDLPPEMLRLVRLTVAAVLADGRLSGLEKEKLLQDARAANIEGLIQRELDRPRATQEIVEGVTDERQRRELYTLAFSVVRADEGVNEAERRFLDDLAGRLGLDPATTASIELETAQKIDRAAVRS